VSTSESDTSATDVYFPLPFHPITAFPSLPSFPFLEAVRPASGNFGSQILPSTIPKSLSTESDNDNIGNIGKRKRSTVNSKKSVKTSISGTVLAVSTNDEIDSFVDQAPTIEDDDEEGGSDKVVSQTLSSKTTAQQQLSSSSSLSSTALFDKKKKESKSTKEKAVAKPQKSRSSSQMTRSTVTPRKIRSASTRSRSSR